MKLTKVITPAKPAITIPAVPEVTAELDVTVEVKGRHGWTQLNFYVDGQVSAVAYGGPPNQYWASYDLTNKKRKSNENKFTSLDDAILYVIQNSGIK